MNVLLDNIIFSLQKAGGASVLWQQHIKQLLNDTEYNCSFLEYDNAQLNFFRNQLSIDKEKIDLKNSRFLGIKRYLNLNSQLSSKHIFHSSHYRVEKGKSAINVTTVHDFTYEFFIKGLAQKVHTFQKYSAINSSDGIICVSNSTKNDLLRLLPNINKNKIRVVYNGVDNAFKILSDEVIGPDEYFFEEFRYALYIGDRRTAYKNFGMAVDACSLANMPMLIVGGGDLTDAELNNLTNKLGVGKYKILLGVSVEDLNFYYNKAYCLIYPSLYEGFGIPVIEAQRAGCPVIAVNSSSIPEVIGNKYTAIENPTPQDIYKKIKELSLVGNLRKETIEKGLIKSKVFSWENTYLQTTEFYNELYFEK
ncbi:glycosyltransferase family 1 protein [Flavobacterium sp. CLA17]|uniref:glycosyltransferase family 4 protein n=1 Tax=Flavobacterium sp. CLA17 TaxID=2724135 RepID=UPI001491F9F8|nr:glycosyltransferase family 1 protein [Flavobacterium sp. CLA17]QSB27966.1 glycosyltransferase family 4 protein [Flavobacterium sp. CLA17]